MFRVGFLGTAVQIAPWRKALQILPDVEEGPVFRVDDLQPDPHLLDAFFDEVDIVAVAGKPGVRSLLIQEALKRGKGVFTRWPPALSLLEWNRLVQLAEEADIDPIISQPLRFHPRLEGWNKQARLLIHHWDMPDREGPFPWMAILGMTLDLYLYLTGGRYLRSFDVTVYRRHQAIPDALAMNLRFQNGAYVQGFLRRSSAGEKHTLVIDGPEHLETWQLTPCVNEAEGFSYEEGTLMLPALAVREFAHYLECWSRGQESGILCREGLPLMRMLEQLMAKIRW